MKCDKCDKLADSCLRGLRISIYRCEDHGPYDTDAPMWKLVEKNEVVYFESNAPEILAENEWVLTFL